MSATAPFRRSAMTTLKVRGARSCRRLLALVAVAGALIAGSVGAPWSALAPAQAAPISMPQVHRIQALADRVDAGVDELRADLVLKVPRGTVDPITGVLNTSNGRSLRVGYDYGDGSRRSMRYINTVAGGRDGAQLWSRNIDEYFTVHKVIPSGDNDFIVISMEGDLNLPDRPANAANRVAGGRQQALQMYFGFGTGDPSNDGAWMNGVVQRHSLSIRVYDYANGGANISGPQSQVYWDDIHGLWSGGQANWGQVLDFGLNGQPAGVLPPNSVSIDILNWAYASVQSGPAGSVSDSFWYAWVDEEGSLVSSINTAPIRITGIAPSSAFTRPVSSVSKNSPNSGGPTLAYTDAQGAQGLQPTVGRDGAIDFRAAGGSGYYRLLIWPESRDPARVTVNNGAPRLQYTASDLFDDSGRLTAKGDEMKWTGATAYYRYTVDRPEPPVIAVPSDMSYTADSSRLQVSGTGIPGHTISLVLEPGSSIADPRRPSLTRLVDGDHEGVVSTDVLVGSDGRWTYEYVPQARLADGTYSLAAFQTDQRQDGYYATSDVSSVTRVTVDTVAPTAPTLTCTTVPLRDLTPSLSGAGVEPGAAVMVYRDEQYVGDARRDGTTWSFEEQTPLPSGVYRYSVRQRDRAGATSPASNSACAVTVLGDVRVVGSVSVSLVRDGASGLAAAAAEAWDVLAVSSERSILLSAQEGSVLPRGDVYQLAVRVNAAATGRTIADDYRQRGPLSCTDAQGRALAAEVFDPTTSRLDLSRDVLVMEPIRCSTALETAHISFSTATPQKPTGNPGAGWTLEARAVDGAHVVSLGGDTPAASLPPGSYSLTARAPSGMSTMALQQLDLRNDSCGSLANSPGAAPDSCWVQIGTSGAEVISISSSRHTAFRLVAAAPGDMPHLPLTGGTGAWLFTVVAAGLAGIAALAGGWRRYLSKRSA